ncbi:MAG: DUF6715 family protein [Lachnospiraceae bacterium]
MMKGKGKGTIRILIAGIAGVLLIVGYYYYISNSTKKTAEQKTLSEIEKVTMKDLDTEYPKTPKAVVKFYNRIVCCMYNEKYSDEDLQKLGGQQRKLLDAELLDQNPEKDYIENLKQDILSYREHERTITKAIVSDQEDVVYKTKNGKRCAYVSVQYFMKEKNGYQRTNQEFVLRQDEAENWKILGFYKVEGENKADDE